MSYSEGPREVVLWNIHIPEQVVEAFEQALPPSGNPRLFREIELEEEIAARLGITDLGEASVLLDQLNEQSGCPSDGGVQTVPPPVTAIDRPVQVVPRYGVDKHIRDRVEDLVDRRDGLDSIDEYVTRVMWAYTTENSVANQLLSQLQLLLDETTEQTGENHCSKGGAH